MAGTPHPRIDAREKVRGRAKFVGDLSPAGLLHARIVGAEFASGAVEQIATDAARSVSGVRAVFLAGDFADVSTPTIAALGARPQPGAAAQAWLPMRDMTVRHFGQPIAIVVAESAYAAREAAEQLVVSARTSEPAISFNPTKAEAPYQTEIGMRPHIQTRGNPEQALSQADHIIDQVYDQAPQAHMPLERHVTLAEWSDGRLLIHEPSQWVLGVQLALSQALNISVDKIDVRSEHFGGGFGGKCFLWPHAIFAAEISRRLDRPVRLELDRDQVSVLAGHRTPSSHHIKLAANGNGTLRAIEHSSTSRGTFVSEDDRMQPAYGGLARMLYACPSVTTRHGVVRTNTPTSTIMRGPAQGPASFALESALDELAFASGVDPIRLRTLNHADTDPEHERPWSSKSLLECYEMGAEQFGWADWNPEPRQHFDDGLWRGRGMASASYYGIRQPSAAEVRLTANGKAIGSAATHDLGTGARTIFAQVVAERLGVPVEDTDFRLGDTRLAPSGLTGISMTTASVSAAIAAACDRLKATIDQLRMENEENLSLADVLQARGLPELSARAQTSPADQSEDVSRYVFGSIYAEISVSPDTGVVTPIRMVGVYDYGRVLNPATADAQLRGGIIQGLGMALWEELLEDEATGRVLNPGFENYRIPKQTNLPIIETVSLDRADLHAGPLGAKGCGEIGFIGVAAAIANAVHHATGKRVRRIPIRPEELREA